MIKTAVQLKDLVRNLARSTGIPNYILLRRYMMERFLERLAQTHYRNAFILKGGMLISDMVGVESRATKDIDATVAGLPLTEENMKQVIQEILSVDVGDHVAFSLVDLEPIMNEAEYEGLRVSLETRLDNAIIPLKIDISTGDAITPQAIPYAYRLMFEDRTIAIKAYPIETVLAEKLETMITRADANSRMRDFYDMHILLKIRSGEIDSDTLRKALGATAQQRGTADHLGNAEAVLQVLENSPRMAELWQNYQMKNSYAKDITWDAVTLSARKLCLMSGLEVNKPSILKTLNVLNEESRHREEHRTDREKSKPHRGEER